MNEIQRRYLKRRKEEIFSRCNHDEMDCVCKRKFRREMKLIMEGNIPIRYIKLKFCDITHPSLKAHKKMVMKYCKDYKRYFKEGIGFYFYGSTGLGKTALGILILKYVREKGKSVYFIDLKDLVMRYTSIWNEVGEKKKEYQDKFEKEILSVDYLMIDGLGLDINSKMIYDIMEKVMTTRVNGNLPTILTARHSIDTFCTQKQCHVPDKMKSLIDSVCIEKRFSGVDFRRNKMEVISENLK